jgi:hypothetical protein|tara:strand:- start:4829 stop:5086 length:258 start_codon:yes stop_codon:yes gene_type:complete
MSYNNSKNAGLQQTEPKIKETHVPMKEQEVWRQKQLSIYYREGRPIFDYDHNKQDPLSPIDLSIPNRQIIYFCESSMKHKKKYVI